MKDTDCRGNLSSYTLDSTANLSLSKVLSKSPSDFSLFAASRSRCSPFGPSYLILHIGLLFGINNVSVRSIYELSLIGLGEADAMRCDAGNSSFSYSFPVSLL
jgi:hypothetical protein